MDRLRSIKQRFGIAAPRVAVRAHVPWYWRWLGILAVGALAAGGGWAMYDGRLALPGFNEASSEKVEQSSEATARQEREISELRSRAVRAERQLEIESAAQSDLARQIKLLSEQNAALKEDLAFFQNLIPAGAGTRGIVVERFRVQQEGAPGEYRYRLFLVQTGQREGNFEGRVQFVVNVVEGGNSRSLTVPPEAEREARDYQLKFKVFQRIEGLFRLSPGAVVSSVQVQVFEQGSRAPKLTQTVNAT